MKEVILIEKELNIVKYAPLDPGHYEFTVKVAFDRTWHTQEQEWSKCYGMQATSSRTDITKKLKELRNKDNEDKLK